MKRIHTFESFLNESLYEAIEIVAVSDYGVSNSNKREYTRKHEEIVNILSNPEEWTDDLVFQAKDGNVYHIDELIDKAVKVGGKTITVVEAAEYSDYPNALGLVNEAEKKTFSKEEVIELLNKFRYKAHATGSSNPNLSVAALDKFIKDEL